jgi:DNA-binding transcriptional MerR regulator
MTQNQPDDEDLVTTQQAAEIAGKNIRTIHRLVDAGTLTPVIKVPGKTGAYMFRRADITALTRGDQ